jgi:taurine dioxygenase
MRNAPFQVQQLAPALGAELLGIDIAAPLEADTVSQIRSALLDHGVIFFRDQRMSPASLKRFASYFGSLGVHPMIKTDGAHPEVLRIVKEPQDRKNFGGDWHSDVTYLDKPALGSVLYGQEIPPLGGDTLFASMYLAYEALSPTYRRMIDGLVGIHSTSRSYSDAGKQEGYVGEAGSMPVKRQAHLTAQHPLVRTHPETGRKALYVNEVFTTGIVGMTEAESRPILEYLFRHCTLPEFACRFRWQTGSVAFWDNRCTQHYALNDYHGQRREMHRVTIDGDRPR